MSSSLDILVQLKKGIDESEELIEYTKRVLNEVRAHGRSDRINILLKKVTKLYNGLQNLTTTFNKDLIGRADEYTRDYIVTYIKYLLMVSIPYEIDLLNEINNRVDRDDNDIVSKLNQALTLMNQLREIVNTLEI